MSDVFAAIARFLRDRRPRPEPSYIDYECGACGALVRDTITAAAPRCACGSTWLRTSAGNRP